MDRIPERLRTAAEGVARATQMMADAKSRRNIAAGDVGSCYEGLKKEQTAEWQAANMIEKLQAAMQDACNLLAERSYGNPARSPAHNARLLLETALAESC